MDKRLRHISPNQAETARKLLVEDNDNASIVTKKSNIMMFVNKHEAEIVPEKAPSVKNVNPNACSYPNCIIVQNTTLESVIKIKQRINRLEDKAKTELKNRLKSSYGDKSEQPVDD